MGQWKAGNSKPGWVKVLIAGACRPRNEEVASGLLSAKELVRASDPSASRDLIHLQPQLT